MSRRLPEDIDPFDPTDFVHIDPAESAPTQAAEPLLPYELGPGAMVGDYRIEGKIGEGGMGVVFSAVHPLIGKRAAIKVLQRGLCTDRTALARFIDEARVVNKIGHPNIVDIFTLGQLPDGRSYLVMEWLAGETLRARIARSRPDLDETCYILRSLTRALDAAHEKGVVHRDLKPDNVFLVAVRGDRPMVKLLDFGIAKLVHADHRIDRTASNQMIGTPLYIAPEQARAEVIDHRADIYALGAMAYEMIVGRPPFDGKSAMEVIAKHMMEPATRASVRVQGIPPELDDLVYAMLEKEPNRRPTLADFSTILDHLSSSMRVAPPVLRGGMQMLDRVAPTLGTDKPVTLGDRPTTMAPPSPTPAPLAATAYTMQANTPAYAPSPVAMTAGAPPAIAMTSPDAAPRRRWLLPALGGVACVIGGVVIAIVVASGGADLKPAVEPAKVESKPAVEPAKTADPVAVEPPKGEVKTDTVKGEVKTDTVKAEVKTDTVQADDATTAAKPDTAKPDTAKPDTAKPDTAKPDTKTDSAKTDTTPVAKTPPTKVVRPKVVRPKVRPKGDGDEEELLVPGTIPRGGRR